MVQLQPGCELAASSHGLLMKGKDIKTGQLDGFLASYYSAAAKTSRGMDRTVATSIDKKLLFTIKCLATLTKRA
jgi:hypothetical protein